MLTSQEKQELKSLYYNLSTAMPRGGEYQYGLMEENHSKVGFWKERFSGENGAENARDFAHKFLNPLSHRIQDIAQEKGLHDQIKPLHDAVEEIREVIFEIEPIENAPSVFEKFQEEMSKALEAEERSEVQQQTDEELAAEKYGLVEAYYNAGSSRDYIKSHMDELKKHFNVKDGFMASRSLVAKRLETAIQRTGFYQDFIKSTNVGLNEGQRNRLEAAFKAMQDALPAGDEYKEKDVYTQDFWAERFINVSSEKSRNFQEQGRRLAITVQAIAGELPEGSKDLWERLQLIADKKVEFSDAHDDQNAFGMMMAYNAGVLSAYEGVMGHVPASSSQEQESTGQSEAEAQQRKEDLIAGYHNASDKAAYLEAHGAELSKFFPVSGLLGTALGKMFAGKKRKAALKKAIEASSSYQQHVANEVSENSSDQSRGDDEEVQDSQVSPEVSVAEVQGENADIAQSFFSDSSYVADNTDNLKERFPAKGFWERLAYSKLGSLFGLDQAVLKQKIKKTPEYQQIVAQHAQESAAQNTEQNQEGASQDPEAETSRENDTQENTAEQEEVKKKFSLKKLLKRLTPKFLSKKSTVPSGVAQVHPQTADGSTEPREENNQQNNQENNSEQQNTRRSGNRKKISGKGILKLVVGLGVAVSLFYLTSKTKIFSGGVGGSDKDSTEQVVDTTKTDTSSVKPPVVTPTSPTPTSPTPTNPTPTNPVVTNPVSTQLPVVIKSVQDQLKNGQANIDVTALRQQIEIDINRPIRAIKAKYYNSDQKTLKAGVNLDEVIAQEKIVMANMRLLVPLIGEQSFYKDDNGFYGKPLESLDKMLANRKVITNAPAPVSSQNSSTIVPNDSTVTPSDSTVTPSDSTVTPSDSTVTPSDSTVTPSDSTVTPSDSTVTPSDSTATHPDSVTTPADSMNTAATDTVNFTDYVKDEDVTDLSVWTARKPSDFTEPKLDKKKVANGRRNNASAKTYEALSQEFGKKGKAFHKQWTNKGGHNGHRTSKTV